MRNLSLFFFYSHFSKKTLEKNNYDEDWIPKQDAEEFIEKKPKLEFNKPKNSKELKRLRLNAIEKRINQDYRIIRQQYGDIIRYVKEKAHPKNTYPIILKSRVKHTKCYHALG